MKRNGSTGRIALAIGADAVTVTVGADRSYTLPRFASADGTAAPIADAFGDVARRLSSDGITASIVDVALLPPLCDVRLVNLPPLRQAEAEGIIRREAGKHFTVSAEHRVVGVRLPRRSRAAGRAETVAAVPPVMAAIASHALLDEITAAAAHTGWDVRRIVPAHAAWLEAANANAAREAAARPRAFVAVDAGTVYVARIENGNPVQLRRLASGHADGIATALGAGPGTALVFADDPVRGQITPSLTSAGWTVLPSGGAPAIAARHAGAAQLQLSSETTDAMRAMRQRALANRFAAAAVVLLLATAGLARWGAQRQLDSVRQRRASIRAQVTPLLALRDSVDNLEARIRETDALFAGGARWSKTLYEVTILLPRDAHFTRLNATGDTLVIEGEGARAGDALQALSRAPTLRNVRMDGPVQRELEAGATSTERFVISATLASAKPAETSKSKRHVQPGRSPAIADRDLGRMP